MPPSEPPQGYVLTHGRPTAGDSWGCKAKLWGPDMLSLRHQPEVPAALQQRCSAARSPAVISAVGLTPDCQRLCRKQRLLGHVHATKQRLLRLHTLAGWSQKAR